MLKRSEYSLRNITNPKVTEYIDKKYKSDDELLFEMRLKCEEDYIPIVQRDVETLLINQIALMKPTRILELGTAIGYSSIMMSKIVKELGINSMIYTVERNPVMQKKAKENIEKFDCKNIFMIEKDCNEALDDLILEDAKPFDLVFVDAGKSHYLEFWHKIMKLVKSGSLVICDNIFMRGMTIDSEYDIHDKHRTSIRKMREFMDYIVGIDNVYTSILPVGDGVSMTYIK